MESDAIGRGRRGAGIATSLLVMGLVLSPYFTVTLSFRTAIVTQAGLVAAFTMALLLLGRARKRDDHWRDRAPAVARQSALLWGAAAVLGIVVALLRGNQLELVAGQAVALGLLPLGVAAAVDLPIVESRRGIIIGAFTGVVISTTAWASGMVAGPGRALYLPNHVSVTGVLPLAILLALGEASGSRGRERAAWSVMLVVCGLYLAALGSRSLLVLVPACAVLWAFLSKNVRPALEAGIATAALCVATALVVLAVLEGHGRAVLPDSGLRLTAVSGHPSPREAEFHSMGELFTFSAPPDDQVLFVSPMIAVEERGAFRIGAEVMGDGGMYLGVRWRDSQGRLLRIDRVYAAAGGTWEEATRVFACPHTASNLELILGNSGAAGGQWSVRSLGVDYLGPSFVSALARHWENLEHRYGRSARVVFDRDSELPYSFAFRVDESRAVWHRFAAAGPLQKLFGHGLGATFPFRLPTFDESGNEVSPVQQNYVHNFYLFLLFKLGVIGSLLILAVVARFLWAMTRATWSIAPSVSRSQVAAVTAAWVAYLGWGVVAPELIDFRVAPLWGMMIVLGCRCARKAEHEAESPVS